MAKASRNRKATGARPLKAAGRLLEMIAMRAGERPGRGRGAKRRAAMVWMLSEAGASYGARAIGISVERVRQICWEYAYQIHRRSEYVTGRAPCMERLRRAGTLLGAVEQVGGLLVEQRFDALP